MMYVECYGVIVLCFWLLRYVLPTVVRLFHVFYWCVVYGVGVCVDVCGVVCVVECSLFLVM